MCSEANWIVIHDITISGQQPSDAGKLGLKVATESGSNFPYYVLPKKIPVCFAGKDDELVAAEVLMARSTFGLCQTVVVGY